MRTLKRAAEEREQGGEDPRLSRLITHVWTHTHIQSTEDKKQCTCPRASNQTLCRHTCHVTAAIHAACSYSRTKVVLGRTTLVSSIHTADDEAWKREPKAVPSIIVWLRTTWVFLSVLSFKASIQSLQMQTGNLFFVSIQACNRRRKFDGPRLDTAPPRPAGARAPTHHLRYIRRPVASHGRPSRS